MTKTHCIREESQWGCHFSVSEVLQVFLLSGNSSSESRVGNLHPGTHRALRCLCPETITAAMITETSGRAVTQI